MGSVLSKKKKRSKRDEAERVGSGWNTHPIKNPRTSPWGLRITDSDLKKLVTGFGPEAMEDRWLVTSDEADRQGNIIVRFFRSWTGDEQFFISITPDGPSHSPRNAGSSGGRITEITWAERLGEEESKKMVLSICKHVLGCDCGDSDSESED